MNKKYRLIENDTIKFDGRILYRIQALKDLELSNGKKILKGELGGFIESEKNLSFTSVSWICDNSKVYGETKIINDSYIYVMIVLFIRKNILK